MKDIKYFPDYKDVFVDEKLKYYFKPICTIGDYHFLTIDGIFCIKNYKYSENYYFGFRLKDGKYEFLGNLEGGFRFFTGLFGAIIIITCIFEWIKK